MWENCHDDPQSYPNRKEQSWKNVANRADAAWNSFSAPASPPLATGSPLLAPISKDLWLLNCRQTRIDDILAALKSYAEAGRAPKVEWIKELEELLEV